MFFNLELWNNRDFDFQKTSKIAWSFKLVSFFAVGLPIETIV